MDLKTKRVLAIDLRPRSFGFVVFEGPDQLLDWGVKVFQNLAGREILAGEKVLPIIRDFQPSIVLLKSSALKASATKRQLDDLLNTIEKHRDRITIRLISPQRIRSMFPDPVENKDDLAERVAARFPDLAWKLPPRRKYAYREHYRMSIFDAAALALAYYGPPDDNSQSQ